MVPVLWGQVAQSVEQRTENPCVGGSIPPLATKILSSRLNGTRCKKVVLILVIILSTQSNYISAEYIFPKKGFYSHLEEVGMRKNPLSHVNSTHKH